MARRKFIQMREPPFDLIEVSTDYEAPPHSVADSSLWNDRSYEGLMATDGAAINSRSKHREYMRRNGLTTIDDFKQTWETAQKNRDAYRTGKSGSGSVRREDVTRAIAQLERRK